MTSAADAAVGAAAVADGHTMVTVRLSHNPLG